MRIKVTSQKDWYDWQENGPLNAAFGSFLEQLHQSTLAHCCVVVRMCGGSC